MESAHGFLVQPISLSGLMCAPAPGLSGEKLSSAMWPRAHWEPTFSGFLALRAAFRKWLSTESKSGHIVLRIALSVR